MTMEELYQKYAGAYDSDFEMPEEDEEEDSDEESEEEEDESEGNVLSTSQRMIYNYTYRSSYNWSCWYLSPHWSMFQRIDRIYLMDVCVYKSVPKPESVKLFWIIY